jgi:hypothetical protein
MAKLPQRYHQFPDAPAASLGFGTRLVNKCTHWSSNATLVELLADAISKSDIKGRSRPFASFRGRVIIRSLLGQSGHQLERRTGGSVENDPMYGPAARCKRVCGRWLMQSCVNVFGLRLEYVLRAIMDISAHAI